MADQGTHGNTAGDDTAPLTVLHVDPDETVLERVSSAMAATESAVDVETMPDPERAYGFIRSEEPDCLVVESTLSNFEWNWLADVADVPVVLYTDADPTDIDDEVLSAADTLVQKRSHGDHEFLFEKIRATIDSHDERKRPSLQEAATELGTDIDDETGIFLVEDDGTIRWSNRPFETVFPVDELSRSVGGGSNLHVKLAALLENDPELIRDVVADGSETGQVFGIPVEDPSWFYYANRFPVAETAEGDHVEVFLPMTDAVERYDQLDVLDRLVENTQDGLYVLDADATVVYCNQSYAEMFGYDREEIIGEHTAQWMAPGELQKGQEVVEQLWNSDADSHVIDLEFVTSDGRQITRSVHFSLRERNGQYAGLLGVVRRPSESAVGDHEFERYRSLVTDVDVPTCIVDPQCTVRVCNDAAAAIFGEPRQVLQGYPFKDALKGVAGGEEVFIRLRSAVTRGDPTDAWVNELGDDGNRYQITVDAFESGPEYVGSVVTFRDVETAIGDL